jgi:LysR family transcriptional regulator, glycine cleavage system transcriptional activator
VIVCSSGLMKGRHPLRRPEDLAHHMLLHTNDCTDWSRWLEAVRTRVVDASKGPIFNQASMAPDAAVDGQGVAIARSALAEWDIGSGTLVRPFELALPVPYAYWIVCPKATAMLPKVALVREWLLAESQIGSQTSGRWRPGTVANDERSGERPKLKGLIH